MIDSVYKEYQSLIDALEGGDELHKDAAKSIRTLRRLVIDQEKDIDNLDEEIQRADSVISEYMHKEMP